MEKLFLIPDLPLEMDYLDGLGFEEYAETLAEVVLSPSQTRSMGIFGEWGHGKSSLMHKIEEQLRSRSQKDNSYKLEIVWFNAWLYQNHSNPTLSLIECILHKLKALKEKPENNPTINKDLLNKIVKLLVIAGIIAINYSNPENLTAYLSAFDVTNEIAFPQPTTNYGQNQPNNNYQDFLELKNQLLKESQHLNLKVIVFLDDLDRCLPTKTLRLLEHIKLLFDLPNFTFIIGISKSILFDQIKATLGHLSVQNLPIQYIEKLFNIHFEIPPHDHFSDSFRKAIIAFIDEKFAKNEDSTPFQEGILLAFEYSEFNPRIAKSIYNNAVITARIFSKVNGNARTDFPQYIIAKLLQRNWPHTNSFINYSKTEHSKLEAIFKSGNPTDHLINDPSILCTDETMVELSDPLLIRLIQTTHFQNFIKSADRFQQFITLANLDGKKSNTKENRIICGFDRSFEGFQGDQIMNYLIQNNQKKRIFETKSFTIRFKKWDTSIKTIAFFPHSNETGNSIKNILNRFKGDHNNLIIITIKSSDENKINIPTNPAFRNHWEIHFDNQNPNYTQITQIIKRTWRDE